LSPALRDQEGYRQEVAYPQLGDVETDDVTLSLTKRQVGSLPEVIVQRRPPPSRACSLTAAVLCGVAAAWQQGATESHRHDERREEQWLRRT
jgi:hypothetical protein